MPDSISDGIADRIVFQYDFSGSNDNDASDFEGHGSNVASIVASQDATYNGMAPATDIIALKVFPDSGNGTFSDVEEALQWVVENATAYNIASVNMSLGDVSNHNTTTSLYGLGDELAALNALDVIVVSSAGNNYFQFQTQGVSYPAADPNSLAVFAASSPRQPPHVQAIHLNRLAAVAPGEALVDRRIPMGCSRLRDEAVPDLTVSNFSVP